MDACQRHYAKWKKPYLNGYIPYSHIWHSEKDKTAKRKQTSGWQRLVWGRPLTTNGNKEIFGRMMGVFYILTVMAVRLLYVHQNS